MEVFNLRTDLEQAAGRPGERTPEDFKAIKFQLAGLMRYTGDELYAAVKEGNYAIYDDQSVRENLIDLQVLIDEITLFNNKKESEEKNENTENRRIIL